MFNNQPTNQDRAFGVYETSTIELYDHSHTAFPENGIENACGIIVLHDGQKADTLIDVVDLCNFLNDAKNWDMDIREDDGEVIFENGHFLTFAELMAEHLIEWGEIEDYIKHKKKELVFTPWGK